MKKIDFTNSGGFPLTGNKTLDGMQNSYLEILQFLNSYLEIPEVGKYIISGCEFINGNLTSGFMYIDGDICYFEGINAANDGLNTKLKKYFDTESVAFKNGNSYPVYKVSKVQQAVDGTALSQFTTIQKKLGILAQGRVQIPNIYGSFIVQDIVIPNLNTADYFVVGNIEQYSSDDIFNNISWNSANHTPTGFKITLKGDGAVGSEQTYFNYKIVKR